MPTDNPAVEDDVLASSRIASFVPAGPDDLDLVQWTIIPNFQLSQQAASNWCWISTSLDAYRYYTPSSNWTQCMLAGALLFGDQKKCCQAPTPGDCNQPGPPSVALRYLSILAGVRPINNLSYPDVKREIDARRALILGYTEPGQAVGHAILILGYGDEGGTGYVYVGDPARGFGQAKFSDVLFTYSQGNSEVSFTRGG
jgi:hypothetical protein